MNRSHFPGSCSDRFRVLPPFALVGLQGTQKYRIRSLPSVSFCFSKPNAAPAVSRERGSPSVADHTIVQCQPSGSSHSPRKFDKHTRSNMALNAHLVTEVSDRAEMISSGICSPQARSTTCTSPPSTA